MRKRLFVDLGHVTCHFNQADRLRAIAEATGLPEETVDALFWVSGFDADCDGGRYTLKEICDRIREKTALAMDDRGLAALWVTAFSPNEAVVDLLRRVEGRFVRILLTDNSPLIEAGLPAVFPEVSACFEHLVFSYKLGGMKKEPTTIQRALDLFECRSDEAFLVDDNSAVLAAAQGLGIHALSYRGDRDLPAVEQALEISDNPGRVKDG